MVTARSKHWGGQITTFRRAAGLTQEQLGLRLDVSRNAVCMWEAGKRVPTDDHKARIAHELRTDVPTLFPLLPVPADTERAA